MTYQKTVGALCFDDYKGPNRQYVMQDKLVLQEREREMGEAENYCLQGSMINRSEKNDPQGSGISENVSFTLNTIDRHCVTETPITIKIRCGCDGGGKGPLLQEDKSATLSCNNDQTLFEPREEKTHYAVRRLTPTECERLQGFPDGWVSELPEKSEMSDEETAFWNKARQKECEIEGRGFKPMSNEQCLKWYNKMIKSESAQYKALGNSIATGPNSFWKFLLKRIAAQSTRELTMGSLFDGIGGFPLVHEQINGKGSCLWASEIACFPIAVTRYHFGEE